MRPMLRLSDGLTARLNLRRCRDLCSFSSFSMLAQPHAEVMLSRGCQGSCCPCHAAVLAGMPWVLISGSAATTLAAVCIDARSGLTMDSPHGDVAVLTLAQCDGCASQINPYVA